MIYKTKEAYRQAWKEAATIDPPIPLNIDLELNAKCNLSCPFCHQSDNKWSKFLNSKIASGLMSKSLAFKIIDEAAQIGIPALKFNWRGESSIHPNYAEILEYAASKEHFKCSCCMFGAHNSFSGPVFFDLLVNTNANCPDSAINGLQCATKVMISHDSLDPKTYPIMRSGGKLGRVKEVIKELIRRGHSNVWVRRVITQLNASEPFFAMVRQEYGDKVHVSQHFCFDRNASEHHQLWDPVQQQYLDSSLYERQYCEYPSVRIVVSATGVCFPCCIDLHETMPIGNLNNQTIMEIWNGSQMWNIRNALRMNSFDRMAKTSACHTCQSWMAYKSPQRNYVQDIEIKSEAQEHEQIKAILQ